MNTEEEYSTATELDTFGNLRCPYCWNSLSNSKVDGSSDLVRCADCKAVFRIPKDVKK